VCVLCLVCVHFCGVCIVYTCIFCGVCDYLGNMKNKKGMST